MTKDRVFCFLFGVFVSFIFGVAGSYWGYLKLSTKIAVPKTICIIDAPNFAIQEAERVQREGQGLSQEPASDGKEPLRKFQQCQEKIDPTISDVEFAKKMYKDMQVNRIN
ncbi:hypothetical protein [Citrobacter freundii]|uniref:hypothetical protein n=1 Tax=Citrobacter freundii TaxID=546 RepID=UPI0032B023FC